jgi:hypothetical protein
VDNSEVKAFIKQVLEDIVIAVAESQDSVRNYGGIINPTGLNLVKNSPHLTLYNNEGNVSTFIDFDIAVYAEGAEKSDGKLNVGILKIGASMEGGSTSKDTLTHRVKFKIPVLLPVQQEERNRREE